MVLVQICRSTRAECEPMEFTFSAQDPETPAVFVCPSGAWATPEQLWCTGTLWFSLSWLGLSAAGALPFTGTAAITHRFWVRTCSSLHKSLPCSQGQATRSQQSLYQFRKHSFLFKRCKRKAQHATKHIF